ncbi:MULTISPECIES: excalibur calcium-binding domain-containing protein [unclassified Acinetobacter]|uniref:excalibur calcium-binding domain-containing protein n=2 Tax=Acinetobacter TaxID=469 RepID=UPI003AF6AB51
MFYLGQIIEYHHDKGYGLLLDHNSAQSVVFYIADFPKLGGQPKKGETIKYVIINEQGTLKAHQMIRLDVAMSNELKNKNINIDKQKNILRRSKSEGQKFGFMSVVILVIVFGFVYFSFATWNQYQTYQDEQHNKLTLLEHQQQQIIEQQRKETGYVKPVKFSEKSQNALINGDHNLVRTEHAQVTVQSNATVATSSMVKSPYQCDGRTHCSQMTSYDEAVFFIKNCPNTQMDGDHDGQPCERQFGK